LLKAGISTATVQAMTAALAHRGPDDHGYWDRVADGVAFGHRRLSILDTSSAGRQPMRSRSGRLHIVYNGEIYNFREIRSELQALGHRFETQTDTEALLAAWESWGSDALSRLKGMWAFAIWDSAERELVLVRDRLGIKPLYYARAGEAILFASEIRSLLASGSISDRVDRQAIWDYLRQGSIVEPRTLLADVRALPAGHVLRLRDGCLRIERYWDVAEATAGARALPPPRYEDAVSEVRRLLEQSCAYHLVSDVPVGAFLSGGIDSTAVVALASRIAAQPLRTFALGFGTEHRALDELYWARLVADRLGCEHTEIVLAADEIEGLIDRVASGLDQPSVDGANTFVVSEAARRSVVVALSGLGGDELFAGYPHFARFARSARLAPAGMDRLRRSAWPAVSARLPGRIRQTVDTLVAGPAERLASFRLLGNDTDNRSALSESFLDGFVPVDAIERASQLLRCDLDAIAQVSYAEINGYLRDTLLRDADAMSMAHSLEIRPMLLDHELVEYAFGLPAEYKLGAGRIKRVLVDALADLLPAEVITRPKMGFDLPFAAWLQGPLRARALDLLESDAARSLFSRPFLDTLRRNVNGGRVRQHRLWSIMVLLAYLDIHELELSA
jgi:asparagine synthase (glutamine-hydrolysing)